MEIISVNGFDLAYVRYGRGIPLVLLHGFPLDHTSWNEVVPFLENDFEVILPDLRGLGQSTTVETPYTISDMADDIAGLLDQLRVEKAVIAGHSMGGYVALAFARNYPQRVRGLGLISSQAAADVPEGKERRYKTAVEVAEKGVIVVADAMTPKLSSNAQVQSFVRGVIEKQNKSGVIGALKAMAERENLLAYLSTARFPVTLIHGDADVLIPIERAKEIQAAVPSAQVVEISGAGHMPMMEYAAETAGGLKLVAG